MSSEAGSGLFSSWSRISGDEDMLFLNFSIACSLEV